jgi:predicted nuclease of restriction endonuclease-like (RecB) superfamily
MKISSDYMNWLADLKNKIISVRLKAVRSLSATLMELYWDIGKEVVNKQSDAGWGSGLVERLALDLRKEFPDMKGFSRRNLYAIRQWYLFYSSAYEFVPQVVAQIPWGHNRVILNKVKKVDLAIAYAKATIENGWSRDILQMQIEAKHCERKGKAPDNFSKTLPSPQSDLVRQTIKDPYLFDFLNLEDSVQEKEIEKQLMQEITSFLLELGKGFAFVGRQYKLNVSDKEYFIDLLFYHLDLRCYVIVELKAGKFKPEFAGKLNFYLSAVDDLLKRADDNPSIGLILCRYKNKIEVEYSLKDINKPMGVSNYVLTQKIKGKLSSQLPSVKEMERELELKLPGSKSKMKKGKKNGSS